MDVGIGVVLSGRTDRTPPLDAEDFEEIAALDADDIEDAALDGGGFDPEEVIYGPKGRMVIPFCMDADPFTELENQDDLMDEDDHSDFPALTSHVTINGLPIDPSVDCNAIREMRDLPIAEQSHSDTDVALPPSPRDPDSPRHRQTVDRAHRKLTDPRWSQIHKINDHKRPGREREREKARTMREQGGLAA